jgi:MarR family transcriptional regulator, transcriptional regulator for hemolysin
MTYRLYESLGFALSRAARIQERRLDHGLKSLGLTRLTWCILLGVGNEGLAQPSDIAAFVGVDRSAVSRALRQLERDGLVASIVGEKDGRTRSVHLTDTGRERLTAGEPLARANNDVMTERLGATNAARLKELLSVLIEGEPVLRKL